MFEPGTGHACVLQACDSDALPAQAAPPFEGAGLLHRRVRVWSPLPQVLLQEPQADQAPQLPLTAKNIIINNDALNYLL